MSASLSGAPRFPGWAIANALEVSGDALLLDVVDHAAESQASDLSAALEGLPWEEKRRILKVVRTLMEE